MNKKILKDRNKIKLFVGGAPLNMSDMICDVLKNEGFDAWVDGAGRSYLSADVIFLPSDANQLYIVDNYLKEKGKKPLIILWQIDPLLPPTMPKEAEDIGFSIINMDWRKILKGRAGHFVQKYVPLGRESICLIKYFLSKRINKILIGSNQGEYAICTSREWQRVMGRYVSFLQYKNMIDFLFTTTLAKQKFLSSKGFNAEFIPFAYHHSFGEDMNLKRDIDVLFLGRLNNARRKKIVKNLSQKLQKDKIRLKVVDNNCYGKQRTELLSRSKISIDLPRVPWDFGIERFIMSMSCGSLIISEISENTSPFITGTHFVSSDEDKFASVIKHYLKNDIERHAITQTASHFVRQECTLQKSVCQIIEKVF